jgi:hypothetical protein
MKLAHITVAAYRHRVIALTGAGAAAYGTSCDGGAYVTQLIITNRWSQCDMLLVAGATSCWLYTQ